MEQSVNIRARNRWLLVLNALKNVGSDRLCHTEATSNDIFPLGSTRTFTGFGILQYERHSSDETEATVSGLATTPSPCVIGGAACNSNKRPRPEPSVPQGVCNESASFPDIAKHEHEDATIAISSKLKKNAQKRKSSHCNMATCSSCRKVSEPKPRIATLAQNRYRVSMNAKYYTAQFVQLVKPLVISMLSQQVSCSMTALHGFNNTGNVCIWPSEEVLAYYLLKNSESFRDRNVIEIGGGMTSLAGLLLATTDIPATVWLTDGNEVSVSNIQQILKDNRLVCDKKIQAAVLRWDRQDDWPDQISPVKATSNRLQFDFVIGADCFFFEEFHEDLIRSLSVLLKPGGKGIFFAPQRSGTLDKFLSKLESLLPDEFSDVNLMKDYDPTISELSKELFEKKCDDQLCDKKSNNSFTEYYEDRHYPLLLTFSKE